MTFHTSAEETFEFMGDIYLWKEVFMNKNEHIPKVKNYVDDLLKFGKTSVETGIYNAKNAFRRTTFVSMNTCYICHKYRPDLADTYMDSFIGKYMLYGWIHCPDCKNFALKDKDRRELDLGVLPLSTYEHLAEKKFKFMLTKGNNSNYIKAAYLSIGQQDCILSHYRHKVLVASLSWYIDENSTYGREEIPFSNLIFNNRTVFGYNYQSINNSILKNSCHFQNSKWRNRWVNKFKEEYNKANTWEEFCKISLRKNIPKDTNSIILNYLGYFYIKEIQDD